jgi:hypothetical protein
LICFSYIVLDWDGSPVFFILHEIVIMICVCMWLVGCIKAGR